MKSTIKTPQRYDEKTNTGQLCEVKGSICLTRAFKEHLCKVHYLELLQKQLRSKIRRMYKDPESAFATFNFRGQATVGLEDILAHPIVKTSFAQEDVKAYLLRDKVFTSESSAIDFLQFKKFFFPQLMLIEDRAEGELQRREESDLDTFN